MSCIDHISLKQKEKKMLYYVACESILQYINAMETYQRVREFSVESKWNIAQNEGEGGKIQENGYAIVHF